MEVQRFEAGEVEQHLSPAAQGCGCTKPEDVLDAVAGSEQMLCRGHQRCSLSEESPHAFPMTTCYMHQRKTVLLLFVVVLLFVLRLSCLLHPVKLLLLPRKSILCFGGGCGSNPVGFTDPVVLCQCAEGS